MAAITCSDARTFRAAWQEFTREARERGFTELVRVRARGCSRYGWQHPHTREVLALGEVVVYTPVPLTGENVRPAHRLARWGNHIYTTLARSVPSH